jgi:UDP-N-acetyl-D-galactosamine dehydrogenase
MVIDVYDSWASSEEVKHEYNIDLVKKLEKNIYDGIIIAVDHDEFKKMGVQKIRALGKTKHVLYDVKYVLDLNDSDIRL